MQKEQLNKTKT